MTVQDLPMPEIEQPTDAVVKVLRACVCGSDLWLFRGLAQREPGSPVGHEAKRLSTLASNPRVNVVETGLEDAASVARAVAG